MSKDEQKKRGGFVPVGDLALDLPGVQVKALRDTMALAQPCGVITRRGRAELQQVESISDLETWRRLAGPKKEDQWQDGRSAKECARAWLELNPDYVPAEISQALRAHPDLGRILPWWSAEPEARIRFDSCRGEPSNLDVLLTAEDEGGPLVIAVEAKADEPFGKTVEDTLREASERRAKNPRSQGVARLEQLARTIECRLTAARLGRFKPIADWDWNWPTALDRPALDRVLALDFLDRAENVLLVGAQGLGKTMLAKNIVHQVVLAGHSARFITASDLLLDLNGQETARALERRLRHYARPAPPRHRRDWLPRLRCPRRRPPLPDRQPPL